MCPVGLTAFWASAAFSSESPYDRCPSHDLQWLNTRAMLPPSTRARSSPQAAGVPSTMTRSPTWVPVSRSLPWVLPGNPLGTFSMGSG
ncbi:hypothetical protein CHARACLAT_027310 [Characodon lateralis]|uniref:Secreted protein n=1 Tax=Characodon lateralis TaxID=208331 RepID=A0ABU7F6X4_9TELE|nr:hypothetical protein [Characodon lateralis]